MSLLQLLPTRDKVKFHRRTDFGELWRCLQALIHPRAAWLGIAKIALRASATLYE